MPQTDLPIDVPSITSEDPMPFEHAVSSPGAWTVTKVSKLEKSDRTPAALTDPTTRTWGTPSFANNAGYISTES